MKTATSLSDDVFEAAEVMIEVRGWTRSRLLAEPLRDYLRNQDAAAITAALDRVHKAPDPDSALARRCANREILCSSPW